MTTKKTYIEYPTLLSNYCMKEYGVFEYAPPKADWLGQAEERRLLGSYKSLESAQLAFPEAKVVRHFEETER